MRMIIVLTLIAVVLTVVGIFAPRLDPWLRLLIGVAVGVALSVLAGRVRAWAFADL
jgi:hypothetical protein